MLESAWLFSGALAILASGVAVSTQTQTGAQNPASDNIAIMSGIAGFVSWGIVAFGSLNIEVVTQDGTVASFALPEVTLLAVMFALVPGLIALTGPADTIESHLDPDRREV